MSDPAAIEGWASLGRRPSIGADSFADWYDVWRAQYAAHRAAEEAERVRMRREIHWMSGLLAAWSLIMGVAAAVTIWVVL